MQWTRLAPAASIFEFGDGQSDDARRAIARAICRLLDDHLADGIITDYSLAFGRVLVEFPSDAAGPAESLGGQLAKLKPIAADEVAVVTIEVDYSGADLSEVAAYTNLTIADVIEIHSTPVYEVEMLGFSPGFPYLAGLDPQLHTPRRATPRPMIKAGAVAIGGPHTGIYSIASPGGWNLIGTTHARMFRPEIPDSPFLLTTGSRVQFIPISSLPAL